MPTSPCVEDIFHQSNNLLPKLQKGCHRRSYGCKDQFLINKANPDSGMQEIFACGIHLNIRKLWKRKNPFTSCKRIRIPECKKFLLVESRIWENLLVESEILDFGIRNTAQGIRNPTNFGIRNPISPDKDWNPVIGIWNPR